MRAEHLHCTLTTEESRAKIWCQLNAFNPPPPTTRWLRLVSVLRRWFFCCWLFLFILLPLWESLAVLCFVVRYFMSILVLQSSWLGRESWLLCLVCLPGVSWRLCASSSRYHGFVCDLWLWYFLIILTYFFYYTNIQLPWCSLTPSIIYLQATKHRIQVKSLAILDSKAIDTTWHAAAKPIVTVLTTAAARRTLNQAENNPTGKYFTYNCAASRKNFTLQANNKGAISLHTLCPRSLIRTIIFFLPQSSFMYRSRICMCPVCIGNGFM